MVGVDRAMACCLAEVHVAPVELPVKLPAPRQRPVTTGSLPPSSPRSPTTSSAEASKSLPVGLGSEEFKAVLKFKFSYRRVRAS